jgi:hypothetical protein
MSKSLLILISGPYLTGTDGDEAKIRQNLAAMESYALPLFKKGHLGMVGEWAAWPVIKSAGGDSHSSAQFQEFQHPVAHRLLEKCDAILRIPGESRGADIEMEKARQMGKIVFTDLDQVPDVSAEG